MSTQHQAQNSKDQNQQSFSSRVGEAKAAEEDQTSRTQPLVVATMLCD
jgi:hypothetical protein